MAFIGIHSRNEAIQYGRNLNHSIQSLLGDIRRNLVYASPEAFRAAAKATPLDSMAKKLNEEADLLEKRAAKKTPIQVSREIDYSTTYQSFVNDWDKFQDQLENDIIAPIGDWDSLNRYDSEFRAYYVLYTGISGEAPSIAPPKTEAEIAEEHPDPKGGGIFGGLGKIFGDIPWTPILLVGGAYLLWTNRDSVKAAFTSKSEEPKALPEKT